MELARVFARQEKKDRQIEILKELVPADVDDIEIRKRLAKLLIERKDYAGAEKYARECLEIDVKDTAVRTMLLESLMGQNKQGEVDRLKKLLGQ